MSKTTQDRLDSYLAGVKHLPPAPTLMIQLIELFQQSDRDMDEVIALMRQNPPLTAEILRQCNGAFFGNEEPVAEIGEAVFRMGFYEIYRLTVMLFGKQSIEATKSVEGVEIEVIWGHSAIVATTGGVLARELGESEGTVFTAGLLHDVGKVVLALAEGKKYADLLGQHRSAGRALAAAEKEFLEFNHMEAGAGLLNLWDVPDEIVMPVLYHHDTDWVGNSSRPAAILNLADLIAHGRVGNVDPKQDDLVEAANAMELLGLKPENLAELAALARADLKRLGPVLSFQI